MDFKQRLLFEVDWWSVGCILYEFCVGIPPFSDISIDKVF